MDPLLSDSPVAVALTADQPYPRAEQLRRRRAGTGATLYPPGVCRQAVGGSRR
jgi:hypothetical protein